MDSIFNSFFTGINYWASKNATKMWQDFDEVSIEKDMVLLKNAGITVLRIFPRWDDFQPLTAFPAPVDGGVFEYGINNEPLPNTEAGKAGVSEEMCQKFERFCKIAEKYGMKLIVGLLTGHMSFGNFIPPALINRDIAADSLCLRWEVRYLKYLVRRFRNIQNIAAWDLGNEINVLGGKTKDDFNIWCVLLSDAIRVSDPTRPILSGVGGFSLDNTTSCNLYDLAQSCDINTIHAYNIFETAADPVNTMKPILDNLFKCRVSEDLTGMPSFIQEFGAIGYTNCSLKSEAEFYRATVFSALGGGTSGVLYWCAFDQGHLTFPPYNWNNIGSNYGFFDKELNLKPIAYENERLQELISNFSGKLEKPKSNCVIMIPREEEEREPIKNATRAAYLLAKRSNLEPSFCYAVKEIPDADLYIFPSVKGNKAITNTNLLKIMENVKNGSVLYISLASAYFRNVCELAGVIVENMTVGTESRSMIFNDAETLPIVSEANYEIISDTCEVLAKDKNANPLFVKNKYGKGSIFFLFAPLEEYLANKNGAFYDLETPNYERIYRMISENTVKKLADTHSKFICTTEHEICDGAYIFAVNYSRHEQSCELDISDEYELTPVWGNTLSAKKITLSACEAIIIKALKRR